MQCKVEYKTKTFVLDFSASRFYVPQTCIYVNSSILHCENILHVLQNSFFFFLSSTKKEFFERPNLLPHAD